MLLIAPLLLTWSEPPRSSWTLGRRLEIGLLFASLLLQLLTFSRKQVLQPTVLDLNALVEGLTSLLRRLVPGDIALVFRPGPGLWQVTADVGQLEQVITNLVVNARDAMTRAAGSRSRPPTWSSTRRSCAGTGGRRRVRMSC